MLEETVVTGNNEWAAISKRYGSLFGIFSADVSHRMGIRAVKKQGSDDE